MSEDSRALQQERSASETWLFARLLKRTIRIIKKQPNITSTELIALLKNAEFDPDRWPWYREELQSYVERLMNAARKRLAAKPIE